MIGTRRQYGIKHHVTSTVHACMGDTLHKRFTQVSMDDYEFMCWYKAQEIVFLSITRLVSNIIFVGDMTETINTLS